MSFSWHDAIVGAIIALPVAAVIRAAVDWALSRMGL